MYRNEPHGDLDIDHRFPQGGENICLNHSTLPGGCIDAAGTPLVPHRDASVRQRYSPPARALKS